jgi:organic hydroperoxide reductase OsmC/OhrA
MEKLLQYQVKVVWKKGREGVISSAVLEHEIDVATPPEFAKGVVGMWSPEHLLVGSVSSCFMTTFLAMAEKRRLVFTRFNCSATLLLDRRDDIVSATQIAIHPILTLSKSSDSGKGLKVLDITAKSCIISAMLKTEIAVIPQIIIEPEELV